MEEESEVYPPPPKLTRGRTRINPDPEIQPIPPRPKRARSKAPPPPEPEIEEETFEPVKKKRAPRKKPEPGSVPPKDVSFNSARGPINFTAYQKQQPLPYEHLHGASRFSHLMSTW